MSQLGRIGGQVLTDNLLRAGVDLAFETDLLYLNVTTRRIGISRAVPAYDFDINDDIKTTNLEITNQLAPSNLRINAPNTITTVVGGISVRPNSPSIFHDRLITQVSNDPRLQFNDNVISSFSNQNITFDPNGAGTVELQANTNITGNVVVSGNINVLGNLSGISSLTLGDQTIDTLTVNTDFTQSIIPGADLTYTLGTSLKRWADVHAPDWTSITTGVWAGSGIRALSANISDQLKIDGTINKISGSQSNQDVNLFPDTGVVYIERTKWQDSFVTNLNDTAITVAGTGIGYVQFSGNNAMVVPAGNNSERRPFPELGETRWNTETSYLECYDGSVWQISTGGGGEVTTDVMEDLSHVYTLIMG